MTERLDKSSAQWWIKVLIIVGLVLIILVGAWIRLPDIAALGLRCDYTRPWSKAVLVRLGPRATAAIFGRCEHWEEGEWFVLAYDNMQVAEADPRLRAQLLSSFRNVNCRGLGGMTPLHCAANWGHREVAELLVSNGADVNAKRDDGSTALHWAASSGRREVAELLISKGADVNAKHDYGATPLHWALNNRHDEVSELLVSKGADVNAKSDYGLTPLHYAAWKGRSRIAEVLVSNGAEPNAGALEDVAVFKAGGTALDIALREGHDAVAELLRKHGAKTSAELDAEKKAAEE